MPWYYAEGALQNGPVTDEEFSGLIAAGKVRPDTLVWREGMAAWQPYSTLSAPSGSRQIETPIPAPPLTATPVGPNEVLCHECGQVVPKENAIQYGAVSVCANCKPLFIQKLREGAVLPSGPLQIAGFWIRFGAKMIDGLILAVVLVVPFIFIGIRLAVGGGQSDPMSQLALQLAFQLFYMAFQVGFNTFFLGKFAATPGKMACGLRVIMSDGRPLSYGRAFGRACAEILSNIICSIGYIIAAFDDQRRTLHDHICDTRVVRK